MTNHPTVSRCVHILGVLLLAASAVQAADSTSDPAARDLMQQAHTARATWVNFPGFTADLSVRHNGQETTGAITVDKDLSYKLSGIDEVQVPWLAAKLRSVILHRRSRPFQDTGLVFADDFADGGPGRLVARADGSGVFRIHDGVITEVHRRSEDRWLEICNLKLLRLESGQVLPLVTSVTDRDPQTGDVTANRSNTFEWQQSGDFHLPRHTLTVAVNKSGERSVRELIFTNHQLANTQQEPVVRSAIHKSLLEPLTSFGACVQGEYLYVFGGHNGAAHGFGRDVLLKPFRRIRFDDPQAEWEELTTQPPAQSTAIVSDGTCLYRVAGLSFRNTGPEEETNFESTTHFARYDPAKNEWTQLTPLPEPRSSLDAAVVGRSIYVAGGWNLQGESSRDVPWHETILRYDLDDPDAGWHTLDGPGYLTRAVSVAAFQDKLYLFGGIQQRGVTRKVSIYDPASNSWSEGPEIKADSSAAGFATSSFATGGNLYYAGNSGIVYRLNTEGTDWEIANRLLFPRMFLRLLPADDQRLLAVGGIGSVTGRTAVVESLRVSPPATAEETKVVKWSVPWTGRARHSQTLLLDGAKLYAFGGNASAEPHDFSEEAFVDESFVFDLTTRSVEQLPDLPQAVQSAAGVIQTMTSKHDTFLLTGGMSHVEGEFRALKQIFEFDPKGKSWTTHPQQLPAARSMHAAVSHEEAVWIIGGSDAGTSREQRNSILHWWGDDSEVVPLPGQTLPTTRRSFTTGVINGDLYVVGGLTAESGIADTVDVFSFEERSWKQAASPTVSRVFPSSAVSEDRLYLFGGFARQDGHFAPASSLEVYDPEANQWQTLAEEVPGVTPSMSMFSLAGRLLFYGISDDGQSANFVLYDPTPLAVPPTVEGMSFAGRRRNAGDEAMEQAKILLRKDADRDGRLSAGELGGRMLAFFEQADANSDSYVTLTEAVAALEAQHKQEEEQQEETSAN